MINSKLTGKEFPVFFTDKNECCGCTACYAICTKGAIRMEVNNEGFLYPELIPEKCIKCYLCLEVCAFKYK